MRVGAVLALAAAVAPESVSLKDESRGRAVAALVCAPDMGAAHQDLFLFAHGGGLYPEDYENLCALPGVTARLVTPSTDGPMDLDAMARDLAFLAAALPAESQKAVPLSHAARLLRGKLSGRVVLAGHSMGGAAAILAAATAAKSAEAPNVVAVGALAPGFWGPDQVKLLEAAAEDNHLPPTPFLVVVGDQDVANSLALQALPTWRNLTRSPGPRTLALLPGATHCQWPSPVRGSCPFDKPCAKAHASPAQQQAQGRRLLAALARGALAEALADVPGVQYVDEGSPASDVAKLRAENCTATEILV